MISEIRETNHANLDTVIAGSFSGRVHFSGNGSELSMISLQSIVSTRTTLQQLTTSMMNAMNDASKSIAGNMGH